MKTAFVVALMALTGAAYAEDPPELHLPPGQELVTINIRSLNPANKQGIVVTTRNAQSRDVCFVYRYDQKKGSRDYERMETLLVIRNCAGR